jgi:hypothetical protein
MYSQAVSMTKASMYKAVQCTLCTLQCMKIASDNR